MNTTEHDLFFPDLESRTKKYTARASVPDFDACVAEYHALSNQAKERCAGIFDIHYGMGVAERLDIFPAKYADQPSPVFVFFHGGYWRSQTKEDAALMASTFTDAGIAVVVVEYTLLPEATLFEVVREVRSAIAWLYQNASHYGIDKNRIHAGGSSAGAHLVGMLTAPGWQPLYQVPDDVIKGGVLLSGLYDLRPLCDIAMNEWLRLDLAQATAMSPLFHLPEVAPRVIVSVGGQETDAFKNQTAAYLDAWRGQGLEATYVEAEHCNHFNLLSELAYPDSDLTKACLEMIKA